MPHYSLIIFDLDGTLASPSNGQTFLQPGDSYKLLPGRAELIKELQSVGCELAIATNQGGVAYAFRLEEEVKKDVWEVAYALGIRRVYMCFNHPKASLEQYRKEDSRRKPGPGMLQEAMADTLMQPSDTLMVGDREEDRLAAEAAGCDFEWAYDFFPVRA